MNVTPPSRATGSGEAPLVELRGVVKRFGSVLALAGVDFHLRRGEVHALLGENGAGKSTLIKVLAGIHAPDEGEIWINGHRTAIRSVADAGRWGIRVIHQELSLVPGLSIAENIYLGVEPHRWGLVRRRAMRADAARLVERLGIDELQEVDLPVERLGVAHRQLVEIAKALSQEARVLILDEPTSSLSEVETEALFSTLRRLRAAGAGLIYISHRLEEIERIADRITVLRDGASVGTRAAAGVDRRELVRWMVDRDIGDVFHRPAPASADVALEARSLRSAAVHGVSFCIRRGEILGIAGLVGSGRSSLARALFGVERLEEGQVFAGGKSVQLRSPRDALAAGIVLVPEDRRRDGLVLIESVAFNIALPWTRRWCRGVWPSRSRRREIVDRTVQSFRIGGADAEACVATLSGGNQQKGLVGRWMEEAPRVLILDEPTRGVDVGAREEMFRIIIALAGSGMAVILISSDLNEVVGLSHRVLLYRDGAIDGEVLPGATSLEAIMARLTGAGGRGS